MARMKGSAIVGQISGMVGGVEFASGRAGMVCKGKRRSRSQTNQRQADRTWFMGIVQGLWRETDDYTRSQWVSFARQNPTTNRFGQAFYMSGFQAMFSYHSLLWDWVGRSSGGGGMLIQAPPPKTLTTFEFTGSYASFRASAMYLSSTPGPWGAWARVWCYAARGCTSRWNGSTNMRYIGSQAVVGATFDWRPLFTAAGCDWVLQAGERIHLVFRGMGGDYLGWPNSAIRIDTTVLA